VLLCCYDSYRQRLLRRFSVQFAFVRRANAARRDICATRHLCATSSVFRYPCFHLTSYVLGSALLMFLLPLASSSPATTTTNALCSAFLLLKAVCHAAVLVVVTHHRSSPPFRRFVTRCNSPDASHRCQSQLPVRCGHAAVAISQSFLLLCTSIFWHRTLILPLRHRSSFSFSDWITPPPPVPCLHPYLAFI
jgi:hypothetical protein